MYSLLKINQPDQQVHFLYMKGSLDEDLLTNNPHLEVLHVKFDDDLIIPPVLHRSFPSVKELRLKTNHNMTFGPELKAVVEAFPNLQKLHLFILANVTADLNELLNSLKDLTSFKLNIHASCLRDMVIGPKLTSLKVLDSSCSIASDLKVFMASNSHLQDLHVESAIGIGLVTAILKSLPNLVALNVAMKENVLSVFKQRHVEMLCNTNHREATIQIEYNS